MFVLFDFLDILKLIISVHVSAYLSLDRCLISKANIGQTSIPLPFV
jgi:hypothetical protein